MAVAAYSRLRHTYIGEGDDRFLTLWPHRFDYLFSPHPDPGCKPQWQTESRHPLSDRLIQQGSYLYGVRFGSKTRYALIDIDRGSPYHPKRDLLALNRLCESLETLGLVQYLTITSSDSGGLHLYFPFSPALLSWQVGLGITTLLENRGFKVMPGWLEVFPNAKAYSPDTQSLYNGHRLPLQQGSYLLDKDLQPVSHTQDTFVRAWEIATAHNDIDEPQLASIISQSRRKTYRISQKAEKFLNDLNAEVAVGWTGHGQTNRLLGRVTMRSYVFGHLLDAPVPLSGQALINHIRQTVEALPGYQLWCRHKGDLDKRIKAWAKSIESSHYFPYGHNTLPIVEEKVGPSWNERQQQAVKDRISEAVQKLTNKNQWADGITARFDLLTGEGISGSSLYKHKSLWHPRFSNTAAAQNSPKQAVEIPPNPPSLQREALGQENPTQSPQAYCEKGCKSFDRRAYSGDHPEEKDCAGCNNQRRVSREADSPVPQQLWLDIHRSIETAQRQHRTNQKVTQANQQQAYQEQVKAAHIAQLREWLASDDPILVAEARGQLRILEAESS